jgi:hypothetical protein
MDDGATGGPRISPAAPAPATTTTAPAARPAACTRCPSTMFDSDWLATFGIALCPACKSADHLISRKTAKDLYLVTDTDLARLGSASRANPHGV